MKRAIVSRQAVAQVVGPNGPVDVGKWDEVAIKDVDEIIEHKPLGDKTQYLWEATTYTGTLKRGFYDLTLAKLIYDYQHPGVTDPPRLILLITNNFNDGTTELRMYKEVLLKNRGESVSRGSYITEDLEWVAEDMEILT